jgi:hypothetical protein
MSEVSAPQAPVSAPSEAVDAGSKSTIPSGNAAKTAPVQNAPELFEVKVNGRVVKMTRDEVINNASMSHAAQSKFKEASEMNGKIQKILSNAKQNPIQALMSPELGLSKEQIKGFFEQWYTQEFIEPSELSPEQRKARETERRAAELEKRLAEIENQKKAQDEETAMNREREHFSKVIVDALDKSGLPKTKWIAQRMAFYMRENLQHGWEAPMDQIVHQVNLDRQEILKDLIQGSDYQKLKSVFGEEVIKTLQRGSLEEYRAKRNMPVVDSFESKPMQKENDSNKISMDEVNRRLRAMRTGK